MMRPTTRATSAAAVLLSTMSAMPASAKPVNRPLADELTRQLNQKELEQLQSGATATYSQPGADQLNRQQLDEPEAALRPGPARPGWSYLPH
jgi:hypothetical protein